MERTYHWEAELLIPISRDAYTACCHILVVYWSHVMSHGLPAEISDPYLCGVWWSQYVAPWHVLGKGKPAVQYVCLCQAQAHQKYH